jgi:hypothetical protein
MRLPRRAVDPGGKAPLVRIGPVVALSPTLQVTIGLGQCACGTEIELPAGLERQLDAALR